jgi:hypothetical protein
MHRPHPEQAQSFRTAPGRLGRSFLFFAGVLATGSVTACRRIVLWVCLVAAFQVLPRFAVAQTDVSGSIAGTVTDPTGALVPEAKVTLNGANHFSQAVFSDDFGVFRFPAIAPGQ